jgi:hypothetical protein
MKKLAIGLSLAAIAFGAQANVLTFEGVQFTQFPANANGYSLSNTNVTFGPLWTDYPGYGNLKWSNNSGSNDFRILEAANYNTRNNVTGLAQGNGFVNGLVSGSWVLFNGGGSDVSFEKLNPSAQNFNFDSAYMSAAWYNGLTVDIKGYRNGVVVNSTTTGPLSFSTALQTFNWTNLDKVLFQSNQSSGVAIDNQSTYNRAFVMDNLSIAAVPEPETYAMLLVGLGLIGGIARHRKSKQA